MNIKLNIFNVTNGEINMHSAIDFLDDYVTVYIRKSIGDYMGVENVEGSSRLVQWFGFDGQKYRSYCCNEPAIIYVNNNKTCYGWSNAKGQLHRRTRPAAISYFKDKLQREDWYENGKEHRIGGPAVIFYRKCGKLKKEVWKENDEIHRQDGPAMIIYRKTGFKLKEEWFEMGKEHRIGGPAITTYRDTGCKKEEEWFEKGIRHRNGHPATITYDKTGKICEESWMENGRRFRSGIEPDRVLHDQDRNVKKEFWFRRQSRFGYPPYIIHEFSSNMIRILYYNNGTCTEFMEPQGDAKRMEELWVLCNTC